VSGTYETVIVIGIGMVVVIDILIATSAASIGKLNWD
jgi:hypothetical protein